jgi:hypothetical protein
MSMNLLTSLAGIDDELGARRGRRPKRAPAQVARALSTAAPGVQSGGARYDALGLTSITFVNGGVTAQQMTSAVQKVFKGSRMVLVRSNVGAASPGLTVLITSLFVGQTNQFVSAQPVPVEVFAPTAFGVEMALDTVTPAINLLLNVTISAAPAAMESVTISGAVLGLTLAHAL